jgi:hypothetical protein
MAVDQARTADGLATVRDTRADLHAALVEVEDAIAGPLGKERWIPTVHDTLVDLAGTFERHIAVTEEPDGLFDDVLRAAPRLDNVVRRLCQEHDEIRDTIAVVLADLRRSAREGGPPEELREAVFALLGSLVRHRQTGADLVYEAYTVDIGGSE